MPFLAMKPRPKIFFFPCHLYIKRITLNAGHPNGSCTSTTMKTIYLKPMDHIKSVTVRI